MFVWSLWILGIPALVRAASEGMAVGRAVIQRRDSESSQLHVWGDLFQLSLGVAAWERKNFSRQTANLKADRIKRYPNHNLSFHLLSQRCIYMLELLLFWHSLQDCPSFKLPIGRQPIVNVLLAGINQRIYKYLKDILGDVVSVIFVNRSCSFHCSEEKEQK